MPRNRKLIIHGKIHEICFRTEEGLPFAPTPYIKAIWESVLARAQSFYRVRIIAGVLMSNHPHLIIMVEDPEDVPKFVGYLKKETSHALNHLLGVEQHTVWQEGYDSPLLGDAATVVERLVYCYTNPQKANLEDTIEKYPGWSTWSEFIKGGGVKEVPRIARNNIPMLPGRTLSLSEQKRLAEELLSKSKEKFELVIEPDIWKECFPELEDADPSELRDMVIERVRQSEAGYRAARKGDVIGAANLVMESIRKPHTPKKRGKRMLCMFSDIELRRGYISWYREVIRELLDLIAKAGTHLIKRPPGLFSPGGGLSSNLNPAFVPV